MVEHRRQAIEIVRFENIGLSFQEGKAVFSGVDLCVFADHFYFLTGPSGAGKTSLIRLIYRDLKPSHGRVRVFHKDLQGLSHHQLALFRQKIGLVFQDFRLLTHLNVLDNVALPLKVQGISLQKARYHAKEMLNWVGLGECLYMRPEAISDGQKQRVAIARAVITRPTILLADEPTGNVDESNAHRLVFLFEELKRMGTTVIFATHNRSLMRALPHIELHLGQGKLTVTDPHQPRHSHA